LYPEKTTDLSQVTEYTSPGRGSKSQSELLYYNKVMICTDWIDSFKSNYHSTTATTAPGVKVQSIFGCICCIVVIFKTRKGFQSK
jgi:hypothetical protein